MKVISIALAATLLASSAFAAPSRGLGSRIKARTAARQFSSRPIDRTNVTRQADNEKDTEYSSNWSGAALSDPPSTTATYTYVSATFTVPTPTATGKSQGTQAASAWVGIDGYSYGNAILQTGVDFIVENGKTSYDAWYEWYPDYAYDFDLDVSAGDVIVAIVQSYSSSSGVAILENQSTGASVTQSLSAPEFSATLGGQNAEWIVEDFEEGSSLVSFVDFNEVVFTGAVAKAGGASYGVDGASVIDIEQNNKILTSVTIESNSELLVQYV